MTPFQKQVLVWRSNRFAKTGRSLVRMCMGLVIGLAAPCGVLAQTLDGPRSVEATLRGNDGLTNPKYRTWLFTDALRPWYAFKDRLDKDYAFNPGFDYTVIGQSSTADVVNHQAVSQDLRFYGTWKPINPGGPNAGLLAVKVENRTRYTAIAPQDLGFESGAVSNVALGFSNAGWILTNLYWQQRLFDDRLTIRLGQIDETDFVDVFVLGDAIRAFQNLAFSVSPAIGEPKQGLGAAAGLWFTDHLYVTASIADANGDPHLPWQSAQYFFETGESFQHVEIGYSASRTQMFLSNIHVTAWHADERRAAAVPGGGGLSMSAAWAIDNRWMPFLRAGFADKGGALYDRSISAGVGYLTQQRDLIGLGLNWARPQGAANGQGTAEAFYRFQVSEAFAVTLNAQLITTPVLNPNTDMVAIFGARTRLAF